MNPNDAELVDVFTRQVGGAVSDESLPVDEDFEVVAEVEAGQALFNLGAQFTTNIVIRDITANDDIPADPAAGFSGQTSSADWPTQAHTFVYTVAVAGLAGRENHICEVQSFLTVGIGTPNVSFATSPMFILRAP
jgi:hypothetical protein